MRSPEHQALDFLDHFARTIPETCPTILGMADQAINDLHDTTDTEQSSDLFKQTFVVTEHILTHLLDRADQGDEIDQDELDEIITSTIEAHHKDHSQKSVIIEMCCSLLSVTLNEYPAIVKALCEYYQLESPADHTHKLVDDEGATVSKFQIRESLYFFRLMNDQTNSDHDIFEQMPYIRHVDISSNIKNQITGAVIDYRGNILRAIDKAKSELQQQIAKYDYPEIMPISVQSITEAVKRLSQELTQLIKELKAHRDTLDKLCEKPEENKEDIYACIKKMMVIDSAAKAIRDERHKYTGQSLRLHAELQGVPPQYASDVPAPLNPPRFKEIESIFKSLSQEIKQYQHACAASENVRVITRFVINKLELPFTLAAFNYTCNQDQTGQLLEEASKIYFSALEQASQHFPAIILDIRRSAHTQRLFGSARAGAGEPSKAGDVTGDNESSKSRVASSRL